jgi:hypothetical protein
MFNGYSGLCFRLRVALSYGGFHCLSLHVSAYMTIFKCVRFFIYSRSSTCDRPHLRPQKFKFFM